MDFLAVASIIVAGVSAFSAIASQRSASRASVLNTQTTSRVDMEREAYERARNFDTETIRRQDEELEECRKRIKHLEDQNNDLLNENHNIRREVRRHSSEVARLNQELTYLKIRMKAMTPTVETEIETLGEEHPPQLPDPPQE